MHSCYSCTLVTHANCHMFYYCFSFHTSPICKFLPFILSAYQHSACCILFPVRTSLLLSTYVYDALSLYFFYTCVLSTYVYDALSLYFFYTCVLFVLCTFLASCMFVQPCTLIVPCTLIAYFLSMCPCDPFHTGHFILTSRFCFLVAVRALPTLGTLPFAHGPPCSMHLLTICNTILVWGILVAHLTPLAHRCSLHYVQSQFSLTHHFIPNYLLFPDTHSLLYMPFFTYVHLSLCSHFLFCAHFQPYAHSLPHLCSSPHSCSLLLHSD